MALNHQPVPSLQWPAMTMDFKVANGSLLAGLKPGTSVMFEFVERQPGEWVITRMTPSVAAASAARPQPAPGSQASPGVQGGHGGHK